MSRPSGFFSVLRFIWSRADHLSLLLDRLPETLRQAGEGLEGAGDGALMAGSALGGDGATTTDAARVLRRATAALEQARLQFQAMSIEVRAAADAMDEVRVPTITPTKQRFNLRVFGLGEPELVTGLHFDVRDPGILEPISARIRAQAEMLDTRLSADLLSVTGELEQLSLNLEESGRRLRGLGESLKAGGAALKALSV